MSQMSLARVERQGDSPPSYLSSPGNAASRTRARATFATNAAPAAAEQDIMSDPLGDTGAASATHCVRLPLTDIRIDGDTQLRAAAQV